MVSHSTLFFLLSLPQKIAAQGMYTRTTTVTVVTCPISAYSFGKSLASMPASTTATCTSSTICPGCQGQQYVNGNGASYQVQCDRTFSGDVLVDISSTVRPQKRSIQPSIQACLSSCDQTSDCVAAVLVGETCTLYSSIDAVAQFSGAQAGVRSVYAAANSAILNLMMSSSRIPTTGTPVSSQLSDYISNHISDNSPASTGSDTVVSITTSTPPSSTVISRDDDFFPSQSPGHLSSRMSEDSSQSTSPDAVVSITASTPPSSTVISWVDYFPSQTPDHLSSRLSETSPQSTSPDTVVYIISTTMPTSSSVGTTAPIPEPSSSSEISSTSSVLASTSSTVSLTHSDPASSTFTSSSISAPAASSSSSSSSSSATGSVLSPISSTSSSSFTTSSISSESTSPTSTSPTSSSTSTINAISSTSTSSSQSTSVLSLSSSSISGTSSASSSSSQSTSTFGSSSSSTTRTSSASSPLTTSTSSASTSLVSSLVSSQGPTSSTSGQTSSSTSSDATLSPSGSSSRTSSISPSSSSIPTSLQSSSTSSSSSASSSLSSSSTSSRSSSSSSSQSTSTSSSTSTSASTIQISSSSSSALPTGPTPVPNNGKRGLCYTQANLTMPFSLSGQNSRVSWAYDWFYQPCPVGQPYCGYNPAIQFIPLLYSNAASLLSAWPTAAQAAIDAGAPALMSFNEPDVCYSGSACMSVSASVNTYQQHMQPFAGRALLGAPAVTNAGSPFGLTYLSWFMGNCTGCTIDFVNIHWYSNKYAGASYFEYFVNQTRAIAQGRPIWVTEFGLNSENPYTQAELQGFLQTVMPWLDQQPDVARYAYFMDAPGILINSAGTDLSGTGIVYNNFTNATTQPNLFS